MKKMSFDPLARFGSGLGLLVLFVPLVVGCGREFSFQGPEKTPPEAPPVDEEDEDPPDWQNCYQGWRGVYSNLTVNDEHIRPRLNDEPAPTNPDGFTYWDNSSYEKYDPTLDFGQNWWPVDEGLEEDPKFFAVHWHAWVRAWSDTTMTFTLGSSDDSWVYVDGLPVAEKPGIQEFVRDTYDAYIDAGEYPIDVWFAHRDSESSGMSFRVLTGDVSICYPDYETDAG